MRIGVPKEIKVLENRVGLTPESCAKSLRTATRWSSSATPGRASACRTTTTGARAPRCLRRPARCSHAADMIVKVKEPQAERARDAARRAGAFHVSAPRARSRAGTRPRRERRGLHRVRDGDVADAAACRCSRRCRKSPGAWRCRRARIASRKRTAAWASCSAACPASTRRKVVVLGGGVVGTHATQIALGMGADVWVLDRSVDVAAPAVDAVRRAAATRCSRRATRSSDTSPTADLVIGGVLIPGAAAPKLVTRAMIASDEAGLGRRRRRDRPGRLLRDVACDDARRPDLRRRRRRPLLRREHAGRRAAHVDVRAQQRDAAVRARARRQGLEARRSPTTCTCATASTSQTARSRTAPSPPRCTASMCRRKRCWRANAPWKLGRVSASSARSADTDRAPGARRLAHGVEHLLAS